MGGVIKKPENQNELIDHSREVLIEACADEKYHFARWTGDAVEAGKVADPYSPLTSVTVDSCCCIKANFEINSYQLKIEATEGGNAFARMPFKDRYDHGSVVEISAEACDNYHFVKWQGPAVDNGLVADAGSANTTLTVEGTCGLEAVFEIDRHSISLSASEGGSVIKPVDNSMGYFSSAHASIKTSLL